MTEGTYLPWFLTQFNPHEHYISPGKPWMVLDFETDNTQYGSALIEDNDLVLACWQMVYPDGKIEKKHKWGGVYEMAELLDDVSKSAFVVAQNAKFELQWLKRCGAELRDILVYDTMLAAWAIDGNRKRPRSLEALAQRYNIRGKVDIISQLIKRGVACRDIHPRWLLDYCHQDVEATRQVFLAQQEELTDLDIWHLVFVRNLCCAVLADIEFEGLTLDAARVQEAYNEAMDTKESLERELAAMTGGINLGSPKQLAIYLYDKLGLDEPRDWRGKPIRTGGGERTANSKAMALLKPTTQEQKTFLALYNKYNKAVSLIEKNLDYFRLTCEQKSGRFFGEIKQGVVQTGRLASSGIPTLFEGLKKTKSVQLQNIPREFKRLFWSGDPDWLVGEADGSQLEFRVAADLGRDRTALSEIEGGTDIHSFTAKVLTENKDPEMLSLDPSKRRQEAKKSTFRPLYGGGSGSDALVAYCEYFKNKYEGISGTQREWAMKCLDQKQFTTPYGMVFYFPDTKMQRGGYITNTTSIYNYPIQGFATGEIIPIALVYFWHRCRDKNIRPFVTVHDSIAAFVHKDSQEEFVAISKQALTYDVYEFLGRVYNYKFSVPLGMGVKISQHWGDTKEEYKVDVWSTGKEIER